MNKPFIVANVRDILDLHTSGEISFSKMVELFNTVAHEFYKNNTRIQVLLLKCSNCSDTWISIMPEGIQHNECPECRDED